MKRHFPDIGMDMLMDMRVTLVEPTKMMIMFGGIMMDPRMIELAHLVNLAT